MSKFFLSILVLFSFNLNAVANSADQSHLPITEQNSLYSFQNKSVDEKNSKLNEVTGSLSDADKKAVMEIMQEISTWPESTIHKIIEYRQFVESARREAKKRYDNLPEEVKKAIEIEDQLRAKISKDGLSKLEKLK
jgi:hypothetical protein